MVSIGVTGAGGAAGVVTIQSLARRPDYRIVALDANPLSAGFRFAHASHVIPMAREEGFLPTLLRIARQEGLELLIPTVDEELLPLAREREGFAQAGVRVIVSDPPAVAACLDKYLLYQKLAAASVPVPQTWLPHEMTGKGTFPVIVKPRTGRGGRGVVECRTPAELEYALPRTEAPIIQEFLSGDEYTVDCLSDMQGKPLGAVPRRRIEVKGGVSWRGATERARDVEELARKAVAFLGLQGPACLQARRDAQGRPKIFEINPRIGGTTSLTIAAGVDIPRLAVQLARGQPVSASELQYRELYVARYFADTYFEPKDLPR